MHCTCSGLHVWCARSSRTRNSMRTQSYVNSFYSANCRSGSETFFGRAKDRLVAALALVSYVHPTVRQNVGGGIRLNGMAPVTFAWSGAVDFRKPFGEGCRGVAKSVRAPRRSSGEFGWLDLPAALALRPRRLLIGRFLIALMHGRTERCAFPGEDSRNRDLLLEALVIRKASYG